MMADYTTPTDVQFAGIKSKKTNLIFNTDQQDDDY